MKMNKLIFSILCFISNHISFVKQFIFILFYRRVKDEGILNNTLNVKLFLYLLFCVFHLSGQNSRLSLNLGHGWGQCNVKALSSQKNTNGVAQINSNFSTIKQSITNFANLNYKVDSSWNLALTYMYISAKTSFGGSQKVENEINNVLPSSIIFLFNSRYKSTSQIISLKPSCRLNPQSYKSKSSFLKKLELRAALELGFGWSKIISSIDSLHSNNPYYNSNGELKYNYEFVTAVNSWKGNTFTFAPSIQIEYSIFHNYLHLGLETGYRYYKILKFKDNSGEVFYLKAIAGQNIPSFNLSGIYLSPYIRLMF